jgi:CRP-like cAMP-binding protein
MDCSFAKIKGNHESCRVCAKSIETTPVVDLFMAQPSRQVSKGKTMFIQGEDAPSIYYIVSGQVKLYRETEDGTQAVIDVLSAGHLFGETALFDGGLYDYSAEIVESAELKVLALSAIRQEIEQNHHAALEMLQYTSDRNRNQEREIEHRTLQSAAQRIGCFILRLVPAAEGQDSITVTLPYDKTLLAARLGMQPETFSRALAKLRTQTGIEVKGATVTIQDMTRLTSYICSACAA